jgi:hypothetical protein
MFFVKPGNGLEPFLFLAAVVDCYGGDYFRGYCQLWSCAFYSLGFLAAVHVVTLNLPHGTLIFTPRPNRESRQPAIRGTSGSDCCTQLLHAKGHKLIFEVKRGGGKLQARDLQKHGNGLRSAFCFEQSQGGRRRPPVSKGFSRVRFQVLDLIIHHSSFIIHHSSFTLHPTTPTA